ncbi:uncharacterized protein LOC122055227 [Zingiber officinale]|uniref:uncharacterized protein LOC122055227 n=1 Tax=Zingiber officinale TaxID=94328 RepID=UPI001C4B6537|nr:uncharacterized protein LOC122055227 [Zingiber officinale]
MDKKWRRLRWTRDGCPTTRVRWHVAAICEQAGRVGRRPLVALLHVAGERNRGRLVVLSREPVEGRVCECRHHQRYCLRGHQRPGHRSTHHESLRPRQRDRDAIAPGGGRQLGHGWREEGGRDGEDLEAASQSDHGRCGGHASVGLTEGDVGDGAGAGENAEAEVTTAGEHGQRVGDVVAGGDLEQVRAHGGGGLGFARDDDGQLGLVLGPRGPSPRPLRRLNSRLTSYPPFGLHVGIRSLRLAAAPAAVHVFAGTPLYLLLLEIMVLKGSVLHAASKLQKLLRLRTYRTEYCSVEGKAMRLEQKKAELNGHSQSVGEEEDRKRKRKRKRGIAHDSFQEERDKDDPGLSGVRGRKSGLINELLAHLNLMKALLLPLCTTKKIKMTQYCLTRALFTWAESKFRNTQMQGGRGL